MPASEKLRLEQIRAFLEGSDGVQFEAENRSSCMAGWIEPCGSKTTKARHTRAKGWCGSISQDDGNEPGATDVSDRSEFGRRCGANTGAMTPDALHTRRC